MDANAATLIEGYLADLGLLFKDGRLADDIMRARRPDEEINRGPNDDLFFARWWLMRTDPDAPDRATLRHGAAPPALIDAAGSQIGNIYLHRFARSDREGIHDHPWDNGTLVIRGRYTEMTPEGSGERLPGQIVVRSAEQRHAIVGVQPGTVSLFVTLKKRREWGFWPDDDTFVHHRYYRSWKDSLDRNQFPREA